MPLNSRLPAKRSVFLVGLAMLVATVGPAQALCPFSYLPIFWRLDSCVVHYPGDSTADPHVADLLKRVAVHPNMGSGHAVRFCPSSTQDSDYYALTPISKDSGVSYYYQNRVFLKEDVDRIDWTPMPPKRLRSRLGDQQLWSTFMCADEQICGRHDAKGFARTKGLSPNLFRVLRDEWSKLSTSKVQFDRVAGNASNDENLARGFSSLRSYLFDRINPDTKITCAYFIESYDHKISYPHTFSFQAGIFPEKSFGVTYKYDEGGIRILRIEVTAQEVSEE